MRAHPNRSIVVRPLRDFLATEAASGVVVLIASATAVAWANSPWKSSYARLWSTLMTVSLGGHGLSLDLRTWVNDAVMTAFFLVVGLEIKRELVEGELRDRRKAALPVFAAIGGMAVPALVFLSITGGTAGAKGWGTPMATDIALAVGLLALAGERVTPGLKLFLLALAIVDDIGAILVIAVFYGEGGERVWLLPAAAAIAAMLAGRHLHVSPTAFYVAAGGVLWFSLHEAGVHATLAGVVCGLLAPTRPFIRRDLIDEEALRNIDTVQDAAETTRLARSAVSVVEWLEHRLHPWTSFAVVPLFALANAGISMSPASLGDAFGDRVTWGVAAGLLVGKPLGVLVASFAAVRLGVAVLPPGVSWPTLGCAGMIAGIGFTVSMFIAELAFAGETVAHAKIGIFTASLLAGTLGVVALRSLPRRGPALALPATEPAHTGAPGRS